MNIPLKLLLIFSVVTVTTTVETDMSTTDLPSSSSDESTHTPASTNDATTVTTEAPEETSTGIEETSTGIEETSTGTIITGTTTDSTDDTHASTTTATTATTTQGPCVSSPCIGDSTCEERFGGLFACVCRPGLVYKEKTGCVQTKVFPGTLTLDKAFDKEMNDRGSKLFQETAEQIEDSLRKILDIDDKGYINSIVLRLREGSIIAEVQNFYDLSSSETSESVNDMIKDGKGGIADFKEFTSSNVCETEYCDITTTVCKENQAGIATCTCKKGFIKSHSTSQACLACPNGEKATDNSENCEKCPFGLSGFNCNDSYLLIVVVVSTVLGALLIIFIVALIVVSCRNQKESSSSQVDFSSSYGNKELHKPAGVPRIPRANPDASWKSSNLEMTDSGSNRALVTRDRPESKAHYTDYYEDISHRGQIPPAYSNYGGREVENGVHNPYFRQDDDKMRRY